MRLWIRGGWVIDPSQDLNAAADLVVEDGRVAGIVHRGAEGVSISADRVLDASGAIVAPGFIDLHCHLREPGDEDKETVATGTRAAARGGFTAVCAMPNTTPPADTAAAVRQLCEIAARSAVVRVLPVGTVTKGRAGKEIAELAELCEVGAVAFSDDGSPVVDGRIMRHALQYSTMLGRPILSHSEERDLSAESDMNEGPYCTLLGLRGNPPAAEVAAVAREIALAELTGGHVHICHVTTAGAVELIRQAKAQGVRVTAEVTPHHLTLTDAWVAGGSLAGRLALPDHEPLIPVPSDLPPYHTSTRVSPPLRTRVDLEALWEGLRDGTIDAIATDHAPHTWVDKECEFGYAAPGISGLETALASVLVLARRGIVELPVLLRALSWNPARILGLPYGTLQVGRPADIVIFDPEAEWVVDSAAFASKGKNTPLAGVRLHGLVRWTLVEGQVVWGPPPEPGV
ncbi:MAG: dihydroorotase [Chloroflexia bacterium]